eukprot:13408613-Ditylum_brightwellii.AAC.1
MLKAGSLASDAEYMSQAMKENVDIVTHTSELDYSISAIAQEDVIQKELFKLSVGDYDNILDEISRRKAVYFELGGNDEIDTIEI